MSQRFLRAPARDLPVVREADVVVLGGGPSGIAAALAAARNGARTLLVERYGFVGGNATIWLPLLGFLDLQGNQVTGGIAQELVDRMAERAAATRHYRCALHSSYTVYDPEALKLIAQRLLLQARVDLLLHTFVADVLVEGAQIEGVLTCSKSGRQAVAAKVYVDCTGDGDVAAWAGAPCEKGDAEGLMQPPTLMFTVRNVDVGRVREALIADPVRFRLSQITTAQLAASPHFIAVGMTNITAEARSLGAWPVPNDRIIFISTTRPDEIAVNMSRAVGTDSTSAESLTRGELESREQIDPIIGLLRRHVPGFENAILAASAPFLGIRESRRILGDYVMTAEDVVEGRRFPDEVCLAAYQVDIHHPRDGGVTLVQPKAAYGIPYRSLLPRGLDNLLVAGRAISATHEAQSAIRVMVPCLAMGEAAGCAAAMAVEQATGPRQVDPTALRDRLRAEGAYLEPVPEAIA